MPSNKFQMVCTRTMERHTKFNVGENVVNKTSNKNKKNQVVVRLN